MFKLIQKILGIILCSLLLLLLLIVNVFAKQKKQPKLEDVRKGRSLENAIEISPIESFEMLVKHKAHYPVKMYNGRNAEILYKSEDKIHCWLSILSTQNFLCDPELWIRILHSVNSIS